MKTFKFLFLFGIISFIFSSCENDVSDYSDSEKSESEFFTLNVTYKDISYNVPCELINDSIIFLDKEFNDLYYNEISLLPGLATLSKGDNVIEYYSSPDELLKKNNLAFIKGEEFTESNGEVVTKSTTVVTGGGTVVGELLLHDDKDFKDTYLKVSIDPNTYYFIPHLRELGFNDKTSSLKIKSYISSSTVYNGNRGSDLSIVMIGYEDNNDMSRTLCCSVGYGGSFEVSDLKKVPIGGGGNWNDKITGVVFRIATSQIVRSGEYGRYYSM
ncbi:hypothetical protein Barb7_00039 [Bacteroidales bacterium Barb7]|nr:hypothetical protein Barb7_00060 [Bacteroidales bacterium Barb7]OAV76295.1 hypothetical protein Barb7_00009 [Bacteroidales bacterium Barb7]OAV76325.1 hypothetical protein Barb7_00039 [Bacteroidales bacterium Barb7]